MRAKKPGTRLCGMDGGGQADRPARPQQEQADPCPRRPPARARLLAGAERYLRQVGVAETQDTPAALVPFRLLYSNKSRRDR